MPEMKRVRIAVVMTADGEWGCSPVYDGDDLGAVSCAGDVLMTEPSEVAEHAVFVEVDVPLPQSLTIEGKVTD